MSLGLLGQRPVWGGFQEEVTWSVLSVQSSAQPYLSFTYGVPVASGSPAGDDTANGSETNGETHYAVLALGKPRAWNDLPAKTGFLATSNSTSGRGDIVVVCICGCSC